MLLRLLALILLSGATVLAQVDGEHHGDPPYLLEEGWRPLLNGKNLSGWHCHPTHGNFEPGSNTWRATKAVRWDALGDREVLSDAAGPGDRIINGGKTCNLMTGEKFGDAELYIEYMVPEGSNSGVYLHGLYEVQILDSFGKPKLGTGDGGAIYHRWIDKKPVDGSIPRVNANRRPGRWQSFHIWFRGPRFDAAGEKIENARFIRVLHNGLLVQEDVELEGPTRAHLPIPEALENPIMLQGDHG
ncbi:MAG: DUF1080 domain-containing protein, partial [bacterium]|nr:DUF1080 domain-containing protein [bacterium]